MLLEWDELYPIDMYDPDYPEYHAPKLVIQATTGQLPNGKRYYAHHDIYDEELLEMYRNNHADLKTVWKEDMIFTILEAIEQDMMAETFGEP